MAESGQPKKYIGAMRANSITIMLEDGSAVDDEVQFLQYLTLYLGLRNFSLIRDHMYRLNYMLSPVVFKVLDGTHPDGVRDLMGLTGDLGFMVYEYTEFKIHKEQSDAVHPTVLGYKAELQPLFDRIEHFFQKASIQLPCLPRPIETSSILGQTSLSSQQSELQTQSDNETLSRQMADCNIGIQSSSQYSKSELSLSATSGVYEPRGQDRLYSSSGVLVSAPSGCGKSLLLEHLSHSFSSVMFGRPISNLSMLFKTAVAKSPCLVLFDDLDTLEHNKKIQHFLNDLPAGVMVVATASKPSQVPAELRQPTALGLDIVLAKPGEAARREIIVAMLQDVKLECDASCLEDLVSCSTAATGRDLNLLVESLAIESLELMSPGQTGGTRVGADTRVGLTRVAVTKVVASFKAAMLTAATDAPTDSHETIARAPVARPQRRVVGYEEELDRLDGCFKLVLHYSEAYAKMNLPPPSRILLFGPTGCGKSWLVGAMASKYSLAVLTMSRTDVFSKYFGESEKKLNDIFDQAIAAMPCILHLQSFDGLASKWSSGQNEVENRVVNLLKARLDGALTLKRLVVVAETSRPDLLDSAIIRRGRFLEYIHLGLPCRPTRLLLAQHWLSDTGTSDATHRDLADQTDGYTVAEVQEVCQKFSGGQDLEASVAAVQPGTTNRLLQKHAEFKMTYQNWD